MSDTPALFTPFAQPTLEWILVSDIEPNPTSGKNATQKSIHALGSLQSILVSRLPEGGPYTYRVHDGKRRLFSAIKNKLEYIQACIVTNDDDLSLEYAKLSLNLNRAANPVDEIQSIIHILQRGGSLESISKALGIPLGQIRKRAKLLELPEHVLSSVGQSLSLGVAEKIANLDPKYREEAIVQFGIAVSENRKFSHDDLKQVTLARSEDLRSSLFDDDDLPQISPLERINTLLLQMCQNLGLEIKEVLPQLAMKHHLELGSSPPIPENSISGTRTPRNTRPTSSKSARA